MKSLLSIIPSAYRRMFREKELEQKREELWMELEALYAEELAGASWWQRMRIHSRISREVYRRYPVEMTRKSSIDHTV